jgi:hypothetical protein
MISPARQRGLHVIPGVVPAATETVTFEVHPVVPDGSVLEPPHASARSATAAIAVRVRIS